MKRSPMPARRTPLKPGNPAERGTDPARVPQRRRTPRDTGPSAAVRSLVHAREGSACAACGISITGRPHSVQHRVARGMGGTPDPEANSLSNLVLLCGSATTPGSCHEACERREPAMRARGFWLYSWENPAEVPIMLASPHGSGMTVRLTPDGNYEPFEGRAA